MQRYIKFSHSDESQNLFSILTPKNFTLNYYIRVMNIQKKLLTITYMKHQDEENIKKFGTLVQEIRKSKSGSLNNIAFSRGGVTSATLSRIENGQVDFKFSTLLKLAHTLDVSLVELFSRFNYKNNIDE